MDYILKKLYLQEGMSLLDIGCGWGFLLIEAAKKYGVRCVGITLSKEQYAEFERKIEEEHLEQLVSVKLMDYRDLPELGQSFDRVVSVGMVEHVGRNNYQLFIDSVKKVRRFFFLLSSLSTITSTYPAFFRIFNAEQRDAFENPVFLPSTVRVIAPFVFFFIQTFHSAKISENISNHIGPLPGYNHNTTGKHQSDGRF